MASSTTNLGLLKPDPAENWSVDNHFNTNMQKIDEFAGEMQNKLVISASSINALKNALDSALAAMPNSGVKAFQVNFTVVEAPFTQASYLCTLYKSASNVTYAVATFRRIDQPIVIDGARNTNGWSFNSLSSKLGFIVRSIQVPYTCEANGQFNTNLKTLIDADLPSGYTVLGVVGFTTNDVNVYTVACRYYNTAYSLQVKNIYTASISNNVVVTYLAKPN